MMRGKRVVNSSSAQNSTTHSYSVMNRIMLRFRPIAPKPPAGENLSDAADLEKRNGSVKRTKRKYVRVRCRQSKSKKSLPPVNPVGEEVISPPENRFVTLQLLPERSDSDRICNSDNLVKNDAEDGGGSSGGREELNRFRSGVDSWIVVECVTETVTDMRVGLRFSDLEKDTCPGFVSDGSNKVVWINEAYRRMVKAEVGVEVTVWLVVNTILPRFCPSFACRVRMVQHTREGQKRNRIVPCDVSRLRDFQGFAWKLDVDTALGLGSAGI